MDLIEALTRCLPPVSYDPQADTIKAELQSTAAPLTAALRSADQVRVEQDPAGAQLSVPDWERVYSLPDPCAGISSSIERRRADIVNKISARGNLSPAQMISVAEQIGYVGAEVHEFGPANCAGPSDQAIYEEADWRFVWALKVPQTLLIEQLSCTSPCDGPIRRWGNEPIFCAISRYKPAHTLGLVFFNQEI
jgi:uncharacterized protein YmfQ (DUF2313 family)